MIYIINDTEVSISGEQALASSPGGSSAFVAGYLNYLTEHQEPYVPLGNFLVKESAGKPYITLPAKSNALFILNLLMYFIFHPKGKKDLLYFHRPDHVALSFFCRAKKIVHLHGQPRAVIFAGRKRLTRFLFLFLEKISMSVVDEVIATDPLTAEYYISCYPRLGDRVHILPTGINRSFFKPRSGEDIPVKKEGKLVFIGRLAYPKLVNRILEAFQIVSVQKPNIRLVVAGEGPQKKMLQSLSFELGLTTQVYFAGKLSKEEVRDLIYSADAAILLSESEGSPISVKEVLACGKPVIVNPVGDLADYIVPDKNGYIVDAENLQQVAEAIRKVFEKGEDMQYACIESMKNFDENHIYERLNTIFTENPNASEKINF